MKKQLILALCCAFCSSAIKAQSETDGLLKSDSSINMIPVEQKSLLLRDSTYPKFATMNLKPKPEKLPVLNDNSRIYTDIPKAGNTSFNLWRGASLGFYGMTSQQVGLMGTERGMVSLNQHVGRWDFNAMAIANKYWMPWQHTLTTQMGYGGTIGYNINSRVSLHAFGYYYANQMHVGPAMSPYVNNNNYGGYADIRLNKTFGAKVGVNRYVNPMNGKWITEPMVNPYIKIGDSKIELPLGGLLKAFVWGDRDNPMRFQPRPQPPVPQGKKLRR